jgi:membrane protease YdiL (CAAX protease family)
MESLNQQTENRTPETAQPVSQQLSDNTQIQQPPVELPPMAPEPEKKVWGGWATVGIGLVILIVFFLAQTFVTIIFLIANPGLIDNPVDLTKIASNGLLLSVATLTSAIAGTALIIVFIKVRRNFSVSEYLGLRPIPIKVIFLLSGLTIVILILSELAGQGNDTSTNFIVEAYRTSVSPVLLWIAVVLFAPLFEESFFRGFLFVGFARSVIAPTGAIILTAFLWSVLHIQYNWFGMMVIFILGIVLGIVRLKTKTLWGSITVHAFWNLLTMIGTVLYANGVIQ